MGAHNPEAQRKFDKYRAEGFGVVEASRRAGVSGSTGFRWNKRFAVTEVAVRQSIELAETKIAGPIPRDQLSDRAKRALSDFSFFEQTYFGVIAHPWQREVAERIAALYDSPEKEYAVVNAPPGSGKTALLTRRIPAWLICRDRAVRMMIGSATKGLARNNVMLLRRELARVHPLQAPEDELAKGLAYDAVATLSQDFGRFKPAQSELWSADAFTVEQMESRGPLSEKEPTVSAYGVETEYTGLRYPLAIWDDLVSLMNQSTPEMREKIERLWMSVCENRIEPGGVIVLLGQRLLADDLYAFVKNMTVPAEELDDDIDEGEYQGPVRDKYSQMIYKVHYEDRCTVESHRRGAKAYPQGCLLVPERISYRQVCIEESKDDFRTVYQQEDVNPADVLIRREWIFGDDDHTGCLDRDRDQWEMPKHTHGEFVMVLTADPSPTNYWAVQLWAYHPESQQRFLIALHRGKMGAPEFLDFRVDEGVYVGLLQDWHDLSTAIGHPFTHIIFEQNGAQKFFLQSDTFRTWRDRNSVEIIPHSTGRNKADPELGITTLKPHYQFGRVRLPWAEGIGRMVVTEMIKELTSYPHGKTDDCVMANWFLENKLDDIFIPRKARHAQRRPSWLTNQRQAQGRRPAWLAGVR